MNLPYVCSITFSINNVRVVRYPYSCSGNFTRKILLHTYLLHIFSDAVAGGLLGEAKRDANKTRILLGLFKEPEVPELENEDEQLDDLEPSKKKRKNKAITVRDPRTKTGRPWTR